MAKTKEELIQIKQELESLNNKLKELSEEELKEISGGDFADVMSNIGHGVQQIAEQVLKTSNTVSPEETLGGKIYVVPSDENNY